MTWGIVLGVAAIMVGCAALSFVITVKQFKKARHN